MSRIGRQTGAVEEFPRAELVYGCTPLQRLGNASRQLGIDLWVKRDDLAGTTLGGGKSRQLEFHLGAAREKQADTILITGAVQSNYARIAAAEAAKFGMRTVIQSEDRVPLHDDRYRSSGNVLLGRLLGAEFVSYPHGEDETGADAALDMRAAELSETGRRPHVIRLGAEHPPLGALGYMLAAREIISQAAEFDVVVVASGSGMTHAGLLAGFRTAGAGTAVIGSCVRRSAAAQRKRLQRIMPRLLEMTGQTAAVSETDLMFFDGALAPGYGRISRPGDEAMRFLAREEGLLLDPVYTAKAFAAVLELVRTGAIQPGSRVLFVHTGGLAAIFAYGDYGV